MILWIWNRLDKRESLGQHPKLLPEQHPAKDRINSDMQELSKPFHLPSLLAFPRKVPTSVNGGCNLGARSGLRTTITCSAGFSASETPTNGVIGISANWKTEVSFLYYRFPGVYILLLINRVFSYILCRALESWNNTHVLQEKTLQLFVVKGADLYATRFYFLAHQSYSRLTVNFVTAH